MTTTPAPGTYLAVRDDSLARYPEIVREPDRPIVDPHYHLRERTGWRYMLDNLLADTNSGHNIVGTDRGSDPEAFRPFGASRCMAESNFPVGKGSYGYGVFWNACKRLAAGASASAGGASRDVQRRRVSFYRLDL